MGHSAHHRRPAYCLSRPNPIKMTDLDLMIFLGYAEGYGIIMGLIWSFLLFFWRRETM